MSRSLRFFAAVLCAAVCWPIVLPGTAAGAFVRAKFVSVDGGFTIDLPNRTEATIRPIGDRYAAAGSFSWDVPEGKFTVGFVEGVSVLPGDGFKALSDLASAAEAAMAKNGARVTDRCEFGLDGFPGVELRAERPGGVHAVNRFILVGQKLYILTADWPASGDERAVRSILDSFDLADTRNLTA